MNGFHSKTTESLEAAAIPDPGLLNGTSRTRPHRKSTVSVLPSFLVSAPAKLIVFGEHAVVHKKVRALLSRFFTFKWLFGVFEMQFAMGDPVSACSLQSPIHLIHVD